MSKRETAQERRDRMRAEDHAAMRARIEAAGIALQVQHDDPTSMYPAGERYELPAGTRRTITVCMGELRALALYDRLRAEGFPVWGRCASFSLTAPGTQTYGVAYTGRPLT